MKTALYILIFIATASFAIAQQSTPDIRQYGLGPSLAGKAGINGGNYPTGRENGVAINTTPDFALRFYAPLSDFMNLGATFDLGYSSYGFKMKAADFDAEYTEKFRYVTLGASIQFGYFWSGANFGLPVAANMGSDIDADLVSELVEFRVGGEYPVIISETGRLNAFIVAGYFLSGTFKDFEEGDPLKDLIPVKEPQIPTNEFNPRPVSLSIGFSYLFDLGPRKSLR